MSTRNWAASATSRSPAPACRGGVCASANTATGPIANQASPIRFTMRDGRMDPSLRSGMLASASPSTTANGTSANGTAKSSGTNASCVATVKPSGVSNWTRVASASSPTHSNAGNTQKGPGGRSAHTTTAAITKPPSTTLSAVRSRWLIATRDRPIESASCACCARSGVNDIWLGIGSFPAAA